MLKENSVFYIHQKPISLKIYITKETNKMNKKLTFIKKKNFIKKNLSLFKKKKKK